MEVWWLQATHWRHQGKYSIITIRQQFLLQLECRDIIHWRAILHEWINQYGQYHHWWCQHVYITYHRWFFHCWRLYHWWGQHWLLYCSYDWKWRRWTVKHSWARWFASHRPKAPTEYYLIQSSSQCRATKLTDSAQYSYTKMTRGNTTYWTCAVRNKATYCRASVTQKDNDFKHGRNGHNHPCEPGMTAHHCIKAKAKTSSTTDMFTSAAEMANNIVSEEQYNAPSLPSLHNLTCTINRKWQQMQPKDPDTLDFNLAEGSLPEGFFQADITVDGHHRIISATSQSKEMVHRCNIQDHQASIHSTLLYPFFYPSGDNIKQVPLMFAFMSGKRTVDYEEVLQAVKSYLPATAVQTITMDFDNAMWDVAWQTFPGVTLLGCSAHWTQAVYCKIQELGLAALYQNDHKTNNYLQKLMALQYLPAKHITPVF